MSKDRILEGKKAEQLVNNPIYQQAIDGVRAKQYALIESSKGDESQKREDSYNLLRALRALENEIVWIIQDGRVAEEESLHLAAIEKLNTLRS
jgi:hypothetical protein